MTYKEAICLRHGNVITVKKSKQTETVDYTTVKTAQKQVIIVCKNGNTYDHRLIAAQTADNDITGGGRREPQKAPADHQIWLAKLQRTKRHTVSTELIQIMRKEERNIRFRRLESHTPFETEYSNIFHTFELIQFIKD